MSSAQLDALRRIREHELVRDILLVGERIDHTNIALQVNVIGTEIDASGLGERQIQLELAGAESESIGWEMEVAPDVHELQVPIAQPARRVASANADIVVDPECYVAAQVT